MVALKHVGKGVGVIHALHSVQKLSGNGPFEVAIK